jgi:transcriptional regulator with XRE-family HTH domain
MHSTIDVAELASRLRIRRLEQGLSVRQAASAAGVSYTTLSRVLRGNHLPDPENLVLLIKWLDISLEQLTRGQTDGDRTMQPENEEEHDFGTHTPENVAHLLLTDRALRPEDVEILMVAFRSMYDWLRARNEGHGKNDLAMSQLNTK